MRTTKQKLRKDNEEPSIDDMREDIAEREAMNSIFQRPLLERSFGKER